MRQIASGRIPCKHRLLLEKLFAHKGLIAVEFKER